MLWFNFILGLKFNFFCFKLIIIYYHSPKQKEIKFKPRIKLNHNIDMEGRWVFAQFLVFPRPNIKKRFSRTFLMEFLDIRRRDVWTVHGWLHYVLPWFGISASSVIYKLREFLSNQPSLHLLYFPPTVVLITLFLIRNICYELTINY